LAYTGCRLDESRWVLWEHVDRKLGGVEILGDPETSTKSTALRRVPIIRPLAALPDELERNPRILRTKERRQGNFVLAVTEYQKAIDRACDKLNIQSFTHHDLRYLFATGWVESGVDIPTVSRWLGHQDGGALAMRTYGHLRDEHFEVHGFEGELLRELFKRAVSPPWKFYDDRCRFVLRSAQFDEKFALLRV
jgi:integrase